MQEQPASAKQPDILSWQYVVLMVAIALLVVLVASASGDVQRASPSTEAPPVAAAQPTAVPDVAAAQPTVAAPDSSAPADSSAAPAESVVVAPIPQDAAALDQHYDDPTGVGFDYPAGWYTGELQPGYVLLTNFPQDVQAVPDGSAIIGFQIGALADLAGPDGSVPGPETTAHDLVQSLLDNNGLTGIEIRELTVGDQPAASVHIANQGSEFEFTLIIADATQVITVRGEVQEGMWDAFGPLFDNVLASMTIQIPAS